MEKIGGIPVEEMKDAGLSNEDIQFIRKTTAVYRAKISEPGRVLAAHDPVSVITIASGAFEAGLTLGVAKAKGLTKVEKKIGF